MLSKKEFLSGCQRIADFSQTDKCYLLIPKIDGSLIELMMGQKDLLSITIRMDRLIGKWLKIKKYFVIPEHEHLCSILFLQPIWTNPGFNLTLTDSTGYHVWCTIPPTALGESEPRDYTWLNNNLFFKLDHSAGKSGLNIILSMSLPFVFIQLKSRHYIARKDSYHPVPLDEENLNIVDFNLQQEDIQIYNYSEGRIANSRLINTSDPSIYLLVFSDILQTSKDCAKLLRRFLKNPDNPVWASSCNALLFCNCRESIIVSTPKISGSRNMLLDDDDAFQSSDFEDRVFLEAIQAFGFMDE